TTAPVQSPQPPAPAPAAAAPKAAREQGLGELWQQILASLELPSTRMLLSQQAELVRLDSQRAVVRVAGPWVAMVQSRLPLLEKAVALALGAPHQVVLEGSAAGPTPATPATPSPAPQTHRAPAANPSPRAAPAAQLSPPAPPPEAAAAAAPAPAFSPPPATQEGASSQKLVSERDPLDENARRLADFFNGEVVELDGPLEEGEAA
ncbi:MAG: DNA polymerase III subunit gamma/tau, partial [Synechococcaceae cyanobacterium ELA445]